MANVFDFQINADENATKALAEMEAKLKQLNPLLNSTRDGLRFGGSETLENTGSLSNKLREMSRHAQDNVQNIGDMIPPLKMFGELSGKYLDKGLKLGGIGAIGYGITKMGQKLNEQSKEAYNLDVMAKNNNMTPEEFSRLSGAMVILGVDADKAKESVDGLYKIFNDPLWARDSATLAQLNSMGVSIIRKDDGTADVMKTMEELAKAFPSYSPALQKTIADTLGFDEHTLALLREGAKFKQLLTKSDELGLTVPNDLNQKLTTLNGTINELNASWEGFKTRTSNATANFLTSDGSVNDGLKGVGDLLTYGPDNFAITRTLGFTRGDESDQLRWGYNNPEFYNTLNTYEKTMLDFGLMTDGYRKKYQQWHLKKGSEKTEPPILPEKPRHVGEKVPDVPVVEEPKIGSENNKKRSGNTRKPRGIRNNNPLNMEFARQKGATVEDHPEKRFAKFSTPYAGLERSAWQLRRYFNGLTDNVKRQSVDLIVRKWAPPGGKDKNRTEDYIDRVAQRLGVGRNDRLDLNNHNVMYSLMREMGMVESKSFPYDKDLVMAAITSTPDPTKTPAKNNTSSTNPQIPGNTEESAGKQDQQYPSLYSKKKDIESETEIAKGMAKAFQDAIGDKPFQVEITLVNDKTGERQKFQSKTAGKITTSMNYP
ncbi:hypothetical protein PSI23_19030 [Xenorhabdus sp. XENO-10]|uniref:Bacteriophage protein n=1 Tax=Xenorhabdus yunnanensis TaxID=3025878 RepID=A0ABT5LJN3_9GAMM|nr:hypothetical protein [Xenorhabdus yunnanensis]MDC9591323.1 hypothetical protein [Xenorhabdus yunnanensis]